MKHKKSLLIFRYVTFLLALGTIQQSVAQQQTQQLWYREEAKEWMEALPLGNGRLSIMAFGGIHEEKIALNEISFWSGQPDPNQEKKVGKEKLREIQSVFLQQDFEKGNAIATEWMSGTPHSFGSHVPIGDLKLKFDYATSVAPGGYTRRLDLKTAVHETRFTIGKTQYTREYFCSNPANAIILKLGASTKQALNFTIEFDLLQQANFTAVGNQISFDGQVFFPKKGPGGVQFAGRLSLILKDGDVKGNGSTLNVSNASEATIVLDIQTDYHNDAFKNKVQDNVNRLTSVPFAQLKQQHLSDYARLYNNAELFLGETSTVLPTNERWQLAKTGKPDPALDVLFFNYARYLLIASSRHNSPLPANLQGIWNDNLANNMGWTNDYHLDINTQQNYWLANVGNLASSNQPLFNYIEKLVHWGQKTARDVYGSKGWTAHTVANIWGYTAPGEGVNWGLFPLGSSWIASHMWEHYQFTHDTAFLRDRAYPVLKSNALFLLDYMVEDPKTGWLLTGPATSPENSFLFKGRDLSLSMMPTADRQLVFEIFSACINSAQILDIDASFSGDLQAALKKLPPIQIGKNGGIQEWLYDFDEAQPNHRHTSHLLGLFPFAQISLQRTPELAKAALTTIEHRLAAPNWEDVEWSRANMICFYARLQDAEKAYESVKQLQTGFARENLLTISPKGIAGAPYDIFIFDGNEAGGAGIAEMLLQSQEDYIELLPALPKAWSNGYFKGLCARGGVTIDASWKTGALTKTTLYAGTNQSIKLKLNVSGKKPIIYLNGKKRHAVAIDKAGILTIPVKKSDKVGISF